MTPQQPEARKREIIAQRAAGFLPAIGEIIPRWRLRSQRTIG